MTGVRLLRRVLGPALLLLPVTAAAQGYRVRLDARAHSVSWRGLALDSIPASEALPGPGGGTVSATGHAVHCSTRQWCYYFRAGPSRRGVPMTVNANMLLWGLGIEGLTIHSTMRAVALAGDAGAWPAADPALQVLEGYAEYRRAWFSGRAGRLLLTSRLEPLGFDGAWAKVRWDGGGLDLVGYAGWGLGLAAVVPATSPLLNPLDEWHPSRRQLVAGAEAAWRQGPVDLAAEYRREVDPDLDYFVSERAAFSFRARALGALLAAGGADYNIAEGVLGSGDLTVSWLDSRWTVSGGARRYRPYFSLWTLWGAFSPVPYHAVHASVQAQPERRVTLRARGERYWYDPAEVSTALVRVEDSGWRVSIGGTATPTPRWTLDASYHLERGPGASLRAFDAAVSFQPAEHARISAFGGRLHRPLEFRFYDGTTRWIGARGEWRLMPGLRAWADLAWLGDDRDRPDASAASWSQVRVSGGVTVTFGTNADGLANLPPARRPSP
jgi:hypothetical protein